eukprot:CAMPEP_0201483934 /NCGR_PEP_ID=MMETSP0151_2-20130828/8135_1 /ASSEMBLY_ACC=CAM_ASM_000257 /TAXON_ID=200890 /ORGANISM="Paramoeba atlantica, Strain 621/1 / CCAP 1560/9" /LENGTH=744 /DNA_ID=CAMNT_0047867329 /DNA_START=95 /DNA_END=2326 /DNA_ORIENTATION=+
MGVSKVLFENDARFLTQGPTQCGTVVVTDKEIMLKEMLFGLTIQTTIPYPFIKVCRRRATAKSTARLVLFSSAGGEKTFLSKKKVDLAFQDSHVTKRFVSVVLGTIGKERGEREEEEVEKEKEKEKEEEKEDPEPLLSARGSRRKPGRPKSPRRRRDTLDGRINQIKSLNEKTLAAQGLHLEDLEILEGVAEHLSFADGATIIDIGGSFAGVYQVGTGTVCVENSSGATMVTIGSGQTFGEFYFTDDTPSEYRLVADDEVILKLLKRDELLRLFATNPTLSANFYGQICCAIRAQLLAINDAVKNQGAERTSSEKTPPHRKRPSQVRPPSPMRGRTRAPSIPKQQERHFKCKAKKVGGSSARGTLILKSNQFQFVSKVFGRKSKTAVLFDDLQSGEATLELRDVKGKAPEMELRHGKLHIMFIGDAIDLAHRAITTAVKAGGVGLTTLDEDKSHDDTTHLSYEDWDRILEISSEIKFKKDAVCISEGVPQHSFYQITHGSVGVQSKGKTIATLSEGEVMGEMGFVQWFIEGEKALASANIIALEKVEMVGLDGKLLSALFAQDPKLSSHFFQYIIHLLRSRFDRTASIELELDWMKIWAPPTSIKASLSGLNKDLHTWLKKDLKLPEDIVTHYKENLKAADFKTLQSVYTATDQELALAGIMLIHRRKMYWWFQNAATKEDSMGGHVVSWMRNEMHWPEDVIQEYEKIFEDNFGDSVADLRTTQLESLANVGIPLIHRRKIAFW